MLFISAQHFYHCILSKSVDTNAYFLHVGKRKTEAYRGQMTRLQIRQLTSGGSVTPAYVCVNPQLIFQFSFQSQRNAMPKNAPTTVQLCPSHMLAK